MCTIVTKSPHFEICVYAPEAMWCHHILILWKVLECSYIRSKVTLEVNTIGGGIYGLFISSVANLKVKRSLCSYIQSHIQLSLGAAPDQWQAFELWSFIFIPCYISLVSCVIYMGLIYVNAFWSEGHSSIIPSIDIHKPLKSVWQGHTLKWKLHKSSRSIYVFLNGIYITCKGCESVSHGISGIYQSHEWLMGLVA